MGPSMQSLEKACPKSRESKELEAFMRHLDMALWEIVWE